MGFQCLPPNPMSWSFTPYAEKNLASFEIYQPRNEMKKKLLGGHVFGTTFLLSTANKSFRTLALSDTKATGHNNKISLSY
jgi:hypothetical protein